MKRFNADFLFEKNAYNSTPNKSAISQEAPLDVEIRDYLNNHMYPPKHMEQESRRIFFSDEVVQLILEFSDVHNSTHKLMMLSRAWYLKINMVFDNICSNLDSKIKVWTTHLDIVDAKMVLNPIDFGRSKGL